MGIFELTIALLLIGAVLSLWADRVGIPYPALLALAGAALTFIPGTPQVMLDPQLARALRWGIGGGIAASIAGIAYLTFALHSGLFVEPLRANRRIRSPTEEISQGLLGYPAGIRLSLRRCVPRTRNSTHIRRYLEIVPAVN